MIYHFQEYNDHVTKNKAIITAHGYYYAPVPVRPENPEEYHYDKNHMVFYWLLKAESGL